MDIFELSISYVGYLINIKVVIHKSSILEINWKYITTNLFQENNQQVNS